MDSGRGGAGPSSGRAAQTANAPAKAKRKKARPPSTPSPRPLTEPIPQPYLALAPAPVSVLSSLARDERQVGTSQMVLPSSYKRSRPASAASAARGGTDGRRTGIETPPPVTATAVHGSGTGGVASTSRRMYAANLLAPPLIMPGGTSAAPRVLSGTTPTSSTTNLLLPTTGARRRTGGAQAVERRRSEERLRDVTAMNVSMASLGQLGQILESDPTVPDGSGVEGASASAPVAGPAQRRRRRVVRGEGGGITRRPTVSSREEGMALGLARGASMRRLNVWDENADAPPPFPFPTTSTSRLPPTFESTSPTTENTPGTANSGPATSGASGVQAAPFPLIPVPNSPPPTFDQAMGLEPLPEIPPLQPLDDSANPLSTPPLPVVIEPQSGPSMSSPSTQYASAPSSPILSAIGSIEDSLNDEERSDRRMWNADLLAGYTLSERVQREIERKRVREQAMVLLVREEDSRLPSTPIVAQTIQAEEVVEETSNERLPPPGETSGTPKESGPSPDETPIPPVPTSTADVASNPTHVIEPVPVPLQKAETPSSPGELVSQIVEQEEVNQSQAVPEPAAHPETSTGSSPSAAQPIFEESEVAEEQLPGHAAGTKETGDVEGRTGISAWDKQGTVEAGLQEPAEPKATPNAPEHATLDPVQPVEVSVSGVPAASKQIAGPESLPTASPLPLTAGKDITSETLAGVIEAGITVEEPLSTAPTQQNPPAQPPVETSPPSGNEPVHRKDPSPANSDEPVENPIPVRKLTRGKAIRRSSSGLKLSSPTSPTSSSPTASPVMRPLFSSGFTFSTSPILPASTALAETSEQQHQQEQPVSIRARRLAHRVSEPVVLSTTAIAEEQGAEGSEKERERRSVDQGRLQGRRLRDGPIMEIDATPTKRPPPEQALPPHREAALRRRESAITRSRPLTAPLSAVASRPTFITRSSNLPSGPLINLNDESPPLSPLSSGLPDIHALASTTSELLQLLEEDAAVPVAESSAQAAAKAAMIQDLQAEVQRQEALDAGSVGEPAPPAVPPKDDVISASEMETPKKKAPPPPPRVRSGKGANERANGKISIVETASSPITPRPSLRRPPDKPDVEEVPKMPALPTRRPPPPPPLPLPHDRTRSPSPASSASPPPVFARRPNALRADSAVSASSLSSSIFDNGSYLAPLPPKIQIRIPPPLPARRLGSIRPKGPRPPPPPTPRAWSKVVADSLDPPARPPNDRIHSDGPLDIHTQGMDEEDMQGIRTPQRSTSERDIRSTAGPRSPEYTDLDVLVSRLESSGREFEGYTQIASFLGPAKSPAATSEALATLLPGLISVDSRRVTKEGKTKLKLSLLGVRVTKCPICLAQFRDKERGVLLPECGHVGHEKCAMRWFREDDRCFVCRVALKKGEGVV